MKGERGRVVTPSSKLQALGEERGEECGNTEQRNMGAGRKTEIPPERMRGMVGV